jgi:hypothetical protein
VLFTLEEAKALVNGVVTTTTAEVGISVLVVDALTGVVAATSREVVPAGILVERVSVK